MSDELVQVLLEGWEEEGRARMLGVLAAANTPEAEIPGRAPWSRGGPVVPGPARLT